MVKRILANINHIGFTIIIIQNKNLPTKKIEKIKRSMVKRYFCLKSKTLS